MTTEADEARLTALFQAHSRRVYAYAARHTDSETAKDVVAEVFLTTWRRLDSQIQASVQDAASASALMQAQPSVIKRPVVEWSQRGQGMKISVGLSPDLWLAWKDDAVVQ